MVDSFSFLGDIARSTLALLLTVSYLDKHFLSLNASVEIVDKNWSVALVFRHKKCELLFLNSGKLYYMYL